ncbi:hypothetical protein [Brumicola blandensis]|uniref:Uncharacterized protein n=1 Tax=Brumicola blandensis TaxID=3075611 RepID=A0AAW8QX12_9ALTE|nr:hypothetical protein [Alteromonas sp. W409]MDT0581521.1 hypothetical protein [Alteromonas sp. W409]
MKPITVFCAYFLLLSPMNALAQTEISVGIDSKYVTEGRDNLPQGGIIWTGFNHAMNEHWSIHALYGVAANDKVSYDELNVTIAYQNTINQVDYVIGITQLAFFKDKISDTEVSVDMVAFQEGVISPYVNLLYSIEQAGLFSEVGIQKGVALHELWFVTPYIGAAFDNGYTGSLQSGFNNFRVGTQQAFNVSADIAVNAIFEQSFGGAVIKNEAENRQNIFWFGMHVVMTF